MKNLAIAGAFALATAISATGALAEGQTHYLAVHVDENDPQVMNLALNNVQNVADFYKSQGDDVMIEMVAYGPGLNMFVDGKSPVADRIETMALEMQGHISFSACGNTIANMTKKTGTEPVLLAEAHVVPAGVIRLMELQNDGWAYLKP